MVQFIVTLGIIIGLTFLSHSVISQCPSACGWPLCNKTKHNCQNSCTKSAKDEESCINNCADQYVNCVLGLVTNRDTMFCCEVNDECISSCERLGSFNDICREGCTVKESDCMDWAMNRVFNTSNCTLCSKPKL